MGSSPAGSWDRVRQTFADQFEQDGQDFIYRRSQKGEAIRVSAEERDKFVQEFDRNFRRAKWIIYVGLTLVFVLLIGLSLLQEPSQVAIFVGLALMMIPYFAYSRWIWRAPARELAGRTPIAGERSIDEVRRLGFRRITYGQLAGAAACGVALPFLANSRENLFSGWNRLWLVFGAALILLAAVQAFRKWRFEQDDSYRGILPPSLSRDIAASTTSSGTSSTKGQFWRFVPLAILILAVLFIAYTPAGKQLVRARLFWPIVMIGCGGWSLFTVAQGFAKSRIEPFMRGFYDTYERETQPKRFWTSMIWNAIFGCLCLWIALAMS